MPRSGLPLNELPRALERKLLEFASELAGEAESEEACVVKLGAREEAEERRSRGMSRN